MSTGDSKPNIGAEIPYRRDRIDKPTGSLVFDQHLHEKMADAPPEASRDVTGRDGSAKPGAVG